VLVSPDGARYLALARGEPQPMPFHLRWLLPKVLWTREWAWVACSIWSTMACAVLVALLAIHHDASPTQAAIAAALFLGLPSTRFLLRFPVLIDAPALAVTLAAVLVPDWRVAAALVVIAACISEKAPLFAAAFALNPWFLLALAVPLVRWVFFAPAEIDPRDPFATTLSHPFRTGLLAHQGQWLDPRKMLLPWGACLVVLFAPEPLWLLPVLVAMAQIFIATDTVRLYQMAAPAVCVAAALLIPEAIAIPVLVAHWFNPWAGNGL
jgi:hypothetical protein